MTDFWIFVCSACSGFHRELNHRVKGVGMTVFKPEELEKLKAKGNQVSIDLTLKVAFEELMGGWNERKNPVPSKKDTHDVHSSHSMRAPCN